MHDVDEVDTTCYLQPKTLKARCNIAKDFISKYDFQSPLYCDGIENDADKLYAALPDRLYIIKDGVVQYKSGPGPHGYKLDVLEAELGKHVM
mmetsp:Transcript_4062/g.7893  ORF Transcript_4062/g.7893 Transcript_4062/m.7893 type:complete len:92 (-) Transcript_4062:1894-2169(-)